MASSSAWESANGWEGGLGQTPEQGEKGRVSIAGASKATMQILRKDPGACWRGSCEDCPGKILREVGSWLKGEDARGGREGTLRGEGMAQCGKWGCWGGWPELGSSQWCVLYLSACLY